MRIFVLALALTAVGCASDRALTHYCTVYALADDLAKPMGLVRLDSSLEQTLRLQLPREMRGRYICWYTSSDRIVATSRRDRKAINYGYEFARQERGWTLLDQEPEIVEMPDVIQ